MVAARKYSFEESAAVGDLKFWGFHNGKLLAWEGYSIEDTVSRLLHGWGGEFAHRILMRDLPPKLAARYWPINARISAMPEVLRAALIARFSVPPKVLEDGSIVYYTRAELARALDVSEHEYRKRLREAKNRYRRVLFA